MIVMMALSLCEHFSQSATHRGQAVSGRMAHRMGSMAPSLTARGFTPAAIAARRMPTWAELVLVVVLVSTVCAGLNHYMLMRTADFLDEQMMYVAASRAPAFP